MTVEQICRIPKEYRVVWHRMSKGEYLKAIGLVREGVGSTRDEIEAYLREHPHLVAAWSTWSDDKRTSQGWYFWYEKDRSIVGYFPGGPSADFTDPVQACAYFITEELADLRRAIQSH